MEFYNFQLLFYAIQTEKWKIRAKFLPRSEIIQSLIAVTQ